MNTIDNKISEFLKSSMSLIDDQDIKRKLNSVQLKYATDLLQKDLEIQSLENNIKKINLNTEKINSDNQNYKIQFEAIMNQLS